jgi:hypothetical protein
VSLLITCALTVAVCVRVGTAAFCACGCAVDCEGLIGFAMSLFLIIFYDERDFREFQISNSRVQI